MLELKIVLKRNPQKNIALAKQFFRHRTGGPNAILDYDYQVRKLYYQMSNKFFSRFLLQVDSENQVCFDDPQFEEFRIDLFYLKIQLKRNPKILHRLLDKLVYEGCLSRPCQFCKLVK